MLLSWVAIRRIDTAMLTVVKRDIHLHLTKCRADFVGSKQQSSEGFVLRYLRSVGKWSNTESDIDGPVTADYYGSF